MSVVFPAPFGPMSPKTVPRSTPRSTAFTAVTPPNRFVSPTISSDIFGSDPAQPRRASQVEQRRDPPWQVHDDDHEDRALEDVPVFLERLQDRRQRGEDDRAEDRPQDGGDPPDDREHEDLHGASEPELVGLDREIEVRGETAGPARDERTEDERGQLVAVHADPLARRGDLVLADGRPGAADIRHPEARAEDRDEDEREADVP